MSKPSDNAPGQAHAPTPKPMPPPGPWRAQISATGPGDLAIGTVWGGRDGHPSIVATLTGHWGEVEAHSRLIAAIPDLIAALRPFAIYCKWLTYPRPFDNPSMPPPGTMMCRPISPCGTIGITFEDIKTALAAIDKAGINLTWQPPGHSHLDPA